MQAVEGVSFELAPGEILAVVGESGSGKSVTAMTLMGLTRSPNADFEGAAHYKGTELVDASEDAAAAGARRGDRDDLPGPDDLAESGPEDRRRRSSSRSRSTRRCRTSRRASGRSSCSSRVGIPRARERIDNYPFEFSGGMRQRVMIALALSCNPRVLIADEPTTALDVTIQAQILQRMRELRDETGAAIILVTHDLGVVADIADRIAVMYAGRIVEQGTLDEIFYDPQHPYTWGLLGSIARVDRPRPERLPAIAGLPPSLADRPAGLPLPAALPARVRQVHRGAAARGAPGGRPATATAAGSRPRRSASAARCGPVRSGSRRRGATA